MLQIPFKFSYLNNFKEICYNCESKIYNMSVRLRLTKKILNRKGGHVMKDTIVKFKLTSKMKEQIETNAEEENLNISEYLRKLVMADTMRRCKA